MRTILLAILLFLTGFVRADVYLPVVRVSRVGVADSYIVGSSHAAFVLEGKLSAGLIKILRSGRRVHFEGASVMPVGLAAQLYSEAWIDVNDAAIRGLVFDSSALSEQVRRHSRLGLHPLIFSSWLLGTCVGNGVGARALDAEIRQIAGSFSHNEGFENIADFLGDLPDHSTEAGRSFWISHLRSYAAFAGKSSRCRIEVDGHLMRISRSLAGMDPNDVLRVQRTFLENLVGDASAIDFIYLSVHRNRKYNARVGDLIAGGGVVVVVGAMHLADNSGLLDFLRVQGFSATALDFDDLDGGTASY